MYCNKNNYIIIELTKDKEFKDKEFRLSELVDTDKLLEINNEWFGFKQTVFDTKGKYYSTKPLNIYRTDLFLRSNLVDKQNTLYNNEPSNVLCHFPVDDGDLIKHQIYSPSNCTKVVNKSVNCLKLEITDANERVVNFRDKPVIIHPSFEVLPLINDEKK